MELKHKRKRFWTLTRHRDGGFTLVELVVVIAILAILAGVGTAGYSGYIKNANKNADKVLVGNIIRAIETGAYSTMFTPSDSLKISATSYPVGFAVLSTDGANILTSGTTIHKVEGACEFVTIKNIFISTESATVDCENGGSSSPAYDKSYTSGELTYCITHSPEIAYSSQYVSGYADSGEKGETCGQTSCDGHAWTAVYSDLQNGVQRVTNEDALYGLKSGGLCEYAYANQNGIYTGSNVVNGANGNPIDTTHPLYQAIYAAYGDLSNLKLTYEGWTSDDGIDFATFYSGAPGVMSSMESLSGILAWMSTSDFFNSFVDGEYENGEEVLSAVSDNILTKYQDSESWVDVWNTAGDKTWDSEGFGLSGRENYSAARMAYNAGFSTYLAANGVSDTYCDIIENFHAQELMSYGIPGLVCTDAFTDSESPLKEKFEKAGDEDGSEFNKIAALFEKYKTSEACAENGRVFYNTMVTFDETEEFATDPNNIYSGDMFDYYNAYVDEISALYTAAQNAVRDGSILIIVSVNNGVVEFQVSPNAANPRND